MIGRLKGILLEKAPPELLVDVSGVAYELAAPMSTFFSLPEIGQSVTLHTHMVVREDAQLLYGFARLSDRSLFRSLLKVSGIGPKAALAILSGMESETFVVCVQNNDVASLTRIPGIGKKTAERLVIEMRDRLDDINVAAVLKGSRQNASQEAIGALIALGYKPQEASRAISTIEDEALSSEELIRFALKNMTLGNKLTTNKPKKERMS